MDKHTTNTIIESLIQAKFEEPDFADCFLIEIRHNANLSLEIFVDSDSGMTFGKCQKISRHIEAYLDESGLLGEQYVLEVSSPGIDRPLEQIRQYVKNIGRLVSVKLKDGKILEGELLLADPDMIQIRPVMPKPKHIKLVTLLEPLEIPFDTILSTQVLVRF
ncbi:MAG: hypothetical protein ABIV51_13955 [Saprospiraceae bacterium]